jgi:hypothetical protein
MAPLGGVEQPRRVVRFARLIHRRVRAFRPALGRRRLRRQSQPDLARACVLLERGGLDVRHHRRLPLCLRGRRRLYAGHAATTPASSEAAVSNLICLSVGD